MRTLDRNEMVDLLTGCAFLGTGGGGEFDAGMRYVDMAIESGKTFKLKSLDEIAENEFFCTPYVLGCTEPSPRDELHKRLPVAKRPAIELAIEALSEHLSESFQGMVACELGAENTAVAAYAAAMVDGFFVDGDTAGRAVPEITHSTYYLNNLPVSPMVMANQFGEIVIFENVFDDLRAEEIAREFSKISCNDIAAADHPLACSQLKGNLVEGTISNALRLGKILNDETLDIEHSCRLIADSCAGKTLFVGQVQEISSKVEDGFTVGEIVINGSGPSRDSQCRIAFKNENMFAQVDDEIIATIPELICVIENRHKRPITNPNIETGQDVTVMLLPAPDHFLTDQGLRVFGPSYAGIEIAFKSALA